MEWPTGVGPVPPAWQAGMLPLNTTATDRRATREDRTLTSWLEARHAAIEHHSRTEPAFRAQVPADLAQPLGRYVEPLKGIEP